MREFFRVTDKKFFALFIVLFVSNIGLLVSEIYKEIICDTGVYDKSEYLEIRGDVYGEILDEIEKTNEVPAVASEEAISVEDEIKIGVLHDINTQKEYFAEYENKYTSMLEYAKTSLNISIFSEDGGFSKNNIEKTLEDFEKVKDTRLEYGYNDWLMSVTNHYMTDIFVFALIIFIILKFIIEDSNGMLYFVRTTKGGRGVITRTRVLIIVIVTTMLTFVFNAGVVLTSLQVYNTKADFGRAIQSVEVFENCHLAVNIGEFIFISIFAKSFVLIVLSFIAYAILMKVGDKKNGIIFLSVFFVCEYLLYIFIDEQSYVSILKYINIFNYINIYEVLGTYKNIKLFEIPVNVLSASVYILAIVVVVLIGYVLYKGTIIYNDKTDTLKKVRCLYDKLRKRISVKLDRQGILLGEAGKLFVILGGILVVLAFGYLAVGRVDNEKLARSQYGKIKALYYEELEGEYNEHIFEKIEERRMQLHKENDELLKMLEESTQEENMINAARLESVQKELDVLENMEMQAYYLKELFEDEGITGYMADDVGVKYLFGEPLENDYLMNDILIGLFIAFFTGSAFAYERKSNMYAFVKSTRNGVKDLWFGKIFWCAGASFVFTAIISYIEYMNVSGKVGIQGLAGAIQSFDMFSDFGVEISLAGYIMIYYLIRCLISALLSVLVLFISNRFNKTSSAQAASIVIIVGLELIL